MGHQKEIVYQRDLFIEQKQKTILQSINREDVHGAKSREERSK